MDSQRKKTNWTLCKIAAIVITALSLSPLVIPMGQYKPLLAGTPYTIWMGFIVSVLLVLLTYLATRLAPQEED